MATKLWSSVTGVCLPCACLPSSGCAKGLRTGEGDGEAKAEDRNDRMSQRTVGHVDPTFRQLLNVNHLFMWLDSIPVLYVLKYFHSSLQCASESKKRKGNVWRESTEIIWAINCAFWICEGKPADDCWLFTGNPPICIRFELPINSFSCHLFILQLRESSYSNTDVTLKIFVFKLRSTRFFFSSKIAIIDIFAKRNVILVDYLQLRTFSALRLRYAELPNPKLISSRANLAEVELKTSQRQKWLHKFLCHGEHQIEGCKSVSPFMDPELFISELRRKYLIYY